MSSTAETSSKNEDKYLPLVMGYLTPELEEKARIELNETDDTRTRALVQFRKKVLAEMAEKKLVCVTTDAYFLQFLRARKFDVDRAFDLFQHYFRFIGAYPDVFRDFDGDKNTRFFETGVGGFCPRRDADGCVVFFWRIETWNPDEFDIITVLRGMCQLFVYLLEDEATQVCGVQAILDLKGATLKQLTTFMPHPLNFMSKALRNVVPIRFKNIHFVHEPVIFQLVWKVLKVLLSDKIKGRIHFHGDKIEKLHNYIPTAILPEMYDGEIKNLDFIKTLHHTLPTKYKLYKELIRTGYKD